MDPVASIQARGLSAGPPSAIPGATTRRLPASPSEASTRASIRSPFIDVSTRIAAPSMSPTWSPSTEASARPFIARPTAATSTSSATTPRTSSLSASSLLTRDSSMPAVFAFTLIAPAPILAEPERGSPSPSIVTPRSSTAPPATRIARTVATLSTSSRTATTRAPLTVRTSSGSTVARAFTLGDPASPVRLAMTSMASGVPVALTRTSENEYPAALSPWPLTAPENRGASREPVATPETRPRARPTPCTRTPERSTPAEAETVLLSRSISATARTCALPSPMGPTRSILRRSGILVSAVTSSCTGDAGGSSGLAPSLGCKLNTIVVGAPGSSIAADPRTELSVSVPLAVSAGTT
ncbi:MAG: hypothetical protein R3B70_42255 [Polyangiaceae bacterium]